MVLDEVLRLHPPALPVSTKEARRDDVLPSGLKIHAGQIVFFSPYCTHRLKKYWGENSEDFVPERWESKDVIKHPYQFVPFQKGPRVCMGMQMAYEEAKTVISILIQKNFKFRIAGGQDLRVRRGFPVITSARNGVKMHVEREKM